MDQGSKLSPQRTCANAYTEADKLSNALYHHATMFQVKNWCEKWLSLLKQRVDSPHDGEYWVPALCTDRDESLTENATSSSR